MKKTVERCEVYECDIIVEINVCKKCQDKGYYYSENYKDYIVCDCFASKY